MAARTIDGPSKDWLSRKEVCTYLGVSVRRLDEMLKSGEFPDGVEVKEGSPVRWSWDDVVFWKLWVERKYRLKKKK